MTPSEVYSTIAKIPSTKLVNCLGCVSCLSSHSEQDATSESNKLNTNDCIYSTCMFPDERLPSLTLGHPESASNAFRTVSSLLVDPHLSPCEPEGRAILTCLISVFTRGCNREMRECRPAYWTPVTRQYQYSLKKQCGVVTSSQTKFRVGAEPESDSPQERTVTVLRGDGRYGAEVLKDPPEAAAEDIALRELAEGANAPKGKTEALKGEAPEDKVLCEAAGRANAAKGDSPEDTAPKRSEGVEGGGIGELFSLGKAAVLEALPELDFPEDAAC